MDYYKSTLERSSKKGGEKIECHHITEVRFGFEFIYFVAQNGPKEEVFKFPISQLGKITTLEEPLEETDMTKFDALIERT